MSRARSSSIASSRCAAARQVEHVRDPVRAQLELRPAHGEAEPAPTRARRTCAATGCRSAVATSGASTFDRQLHGERPSSEASDWTIARAAARGRARARCRAATSTGVRRWSRSDASRCGRSTRRPIRSSSYWSAGSYACAAGVMSAPKRRTPSRRNPRTGAGPSPWCSAPRRLARQLTLDVELPRGQLPLAAGGARTDRPGGDLPDPRFELRLASTGVSPPTAMPATVDARRHARRRAGESEAEHADGEGDEPNGDGGPLPEQSVRPSAVARVDSTLGPSDDQCIAGPCRARAAC